MIRTRVRYGINYSLLLLFSSYALLCRFDFISLTLQLSLAPPRSPQLLLPASLEVRILLACLNPHLNIRVVYRIVRGLSLIVEHISFSTFNLM